MTVLTNVILLVVAVVLQLRLLPLFSIKGIIPDLILILVVMITFQRGRMWGIIGGFLAGFVFDLWGTGILGLSSLTYPLSAFVAGLWREQPDRRLSTIIGPLFLTLLVHDLIYYLILRVGTFVGFWKTLIAVAIPTSIYTLVFLSIVYLAVPSVLGKRID